MSKRRFLFGAAILISGPIFVLLFFKDPSASALLSPIPQTGVLGYNIWLPQPASDRSFSDAPEVVAQSAYFVDIDTGKVLYQKNAFERRPIASLTKIMTAIVALEHKDFGDVMTVSSHAADMEPDHMGLLTGEKLSVEELLYGVFLISGNDAAEVLAENSTGDRDEFIKLMNIKAKELSMKDTLFINPTGLEEDGQNQYSTAYDVALMARYAIKKFPHLVYISSTPEKDLPETSTHQAYTLTSGINLLTTYPGVKGFKTGYTPEAGLTLVTYAEKDGRSIVGVILNSDQRREDARALLDYSFAETE